MKKLSEKRKKWIERTVANNRSYKHYLYNRLCIILLLILLQLVAYGILMYLFAYDSKVGGTVQLVVGILEIVFLLYLINNTDRPSMKLNWILLILLVPFIGVPSYILYGENRPTKHMNRKIERAKQENEEAFSKVYGEWNGAQEESGGSISRYLTAYGKYPSYGGGAIDYYKSGEAAFPVMMEALEKAEKFILLDYFIIAHGKMWNTILKTLLEKAEQGVRVRIIYDDFGCMTTLPPRYEKYLESLHENIRCMTFNSIIPIFALRMNNRDHRKILVVDGKVAFTGGINLADEYIAEKKRFGYWKDSVIRVKGDAVNSFTKMFFNFWNAFRKDKEDLKEYLLPLQNEGGRVEVNGLRVQPYDDSPLDGISVGETVYLNMINRASKYAYIFTPYLILDDQMRTSLMLAAMRGVDVRIVVPGIPDKKMAYRLTRANYEMLTRAGVKIYEYTPGFLHAKSIVCDDTCAVVGTINFDYRSLCHHFENAVYFENCPAVMDVKRDCEETFALSKLCPKGYPKRTLIGRTLDAVLRVFETLF